MLNLNNVKLLRKRTIVHLALIVLVVSGVILPTPLPSPLPIGEVEAQSCSPRGIVIFGSSYSYDWIANGEPSSSSCWAYSRTATSFVTGTTACGWASNAWEFGYGGHISQSFTIPSDMTQPGFAIQYLLDFDDPNDSPWNRFTMEVVDLTTGVQLASDYFIGNMGDLYCSYRSQSWTQNLAGHTIQVRFTGSRAYQSTHIRVRQIGLYQNLHS